MSTVTDMEVMLKMRPKQEDLVEKGIMERMPDADSDDEGGAQGSDADDELAADRTHDISILRSLLFLTIQEALKDACINCHNDEQLVIDEMNQITRSLKDLRDTLDQYNVTNILEFEAEEDRVRERFRSLQMQMLRIGERQQGISKRLEILHKVERNLFDLQRAYSRELRTLQRREENLLNTLRRLKASKERAEKIMYAERSHQNWAMAKLNYTIDVSKQASELSKKKIASEEAKYAEQDYEADVAFTDELSGFLTSLKDLYEKQSSVVSNFESALENYEMELWEVQNEQIMLRKETFAQIYALHRDVEVADLMDIGGRRVSVASPTEIHKERKHHATKVQRMLNTLNKQLSEMKIDILAQQMSEIVDVQTVMSESNLKCFFTVFVQAFTQMIIDIELLWRQFETGVGIESKTLDFMETMLGRKVLPEKETQAALKRCYDFLLILKGAVRSEQIELSKIYARRMGVVITDELMADLRVDANQIDTVAMFIARKLTIDSSMQSDLTDSLSEEEVASLVVARCSDVFRAVVTRPIFTGVPRSVKDAASDILQQVWRIRVHRDD
jgi:hypothetical protein